MKKFDADFKKNAVKLVIEEKLTIKQVSQDLGSVSKVYTI